MRIGIDGYNLAMTHGTGIASYGFTLAQTLRDMGHRIEGVFGLDVGQDVATREVLFFDALSQDESRQRTKKEIQRHAARILRKAINPLGARKLLEVPLSEKVEKSSFAERLPAFDRLTSFPSLFEVAHRHFALYGRLLRIRMQDPPDIMHWTYPVPLQLEGARNIYTLHDIVPLRLPYTTLDIKKNYFALIKACIEAADQVCTISEASCKDIQAAFPVGPEILFNTYQASSLPAAVFERSEAEDAEMIEGVFGLKRHGYFLFFGSIEPKKNIGRLIEAYLSIGSPHPLVIVGSRSWRAEEELKLLPRDQGGFGSKGKVIRFDYLPRALLIRLIRGARAVTFPSLYEGFGLPVLEAMQLGTPVLTSRVSSLPEVGGDAVSYADPYDTASIADALKRIDNDDGLRAELGRRGPEQAQKFSSSCYQERLSLLYERALQSPR